LIHFYKRYLEERRGIVRRHEDDDDYQRICCALLKSDMEHRNLAIKFSQLRLPQHRVTQAGQGRNTDRLFRFRPSMDQLVHDFNTALDETAGSNSSSRSSASRRKSWKRRCKSTSNLNTGNNVSDDSSSSVDNVGLLSRDRGTSSLQFSDSDLDILDIPGAATMTRQGRSRTKRGRGDIIMGIESDSFTENVQPWQDFRVHTKRRRKFKRMAIGPGVEVTTVRGVKATKRKKVRSRSGFDGRNLDPKTGGGITPGKRKRSAREKSVESGDLLGNDSRLRTVSLGETDKMELEDEESSSSLSSSEWEDVDNCPEAGEADDEQSDWPGHDPGLTDEELDSEISFNTRKLVSGGRVMRAGSRRLKSSNRSPPYGEMLNRFIKDPSMQSLRLTNVKSNDRNMILSLARLYNLSVNIDLGTIIVGKQGRHLRSVDPETDHTCPEFVVPGVPPVQQINRSGQYRDNKETHKKQRKYGPPVQEPGGNNFVSVSGVTTRQQHSSGSRHRLYQPPSTVGSQSN